MRRLRGAIGIALVVMAIVVVTVTVLRRTGVLLLGDVVSRVETSEKLVALTFDDGPLPPHTARVLDALDTAGVRATFFMLGQNVEAHRAAARAVVARGHEVGNHGYSHAELVLVSPAFARSEISRTDALLRGIGAAGDIPFRSPFGTQLVVLPWVLAEQERANVLFDVIPRDWENPPADVLVRRVLEQTRPGSIILMHDEGEATADAVGPIARGLRDRGYRFVTVTELLSRRSR